MSPAVDPRTLSDAIHAALLGVALNPCVTLRPERGAVWITVTHTVGPESIEFSDRFDSGSLLSAIPWAVRMVRSREGTRTPIQAPSAKFTGPDRSPARPYVQWRNEDGTFGGGM